MDGVLKQGKCKIPRAKEAIMKLRERGIPLSLITNNGGELESSRANKISKILDLEENYKFTENEVFMCHTPMKELVSKFKDKLILISGVNKIEGLIQRYGFNKYMTVLEYGTIFNKITPLLSYQINEDERKSIINRVEKRLSTSIKDSESYIQVHGIFILSGLLNWEVNTQVIILFI